VNRAIVVACIAQRLRSPVRMTIASFAFVFPLLGVALMPAMGLSSLGNGFNFALIFSAGMIGQEISAGVLQLVFARPLRRDEYVFSRWFACAFLAATLASLQIAIGAVILALRGFPPETSATLAALGTHALAAIGTASVFALFSAIMGGLGDLALFLLATLVGGGFQLLGGATANRAYMRAGEEIVRFVQPQLDVATLMAATTVPWFTVLSYLSTVTLCLALAVVVVNRKELSYASS
jgi:ABC-type transport system involved in multi-copper enzyme maturation permease subunit